MSSADWKANLSLWHMLYSISFFPFNLMTYWWCYIYYWQPVVTSLIIIIDVIVIFQQQTWIYFLHLDLNQETRNGQREV